MNEFKKYMYYKFIQSFINDENMYELLEKYGSVILTDDFIKCMGMFCLEHIEENHLDEIQLGRFIELVSYLKNNLETNKKYSWLINKMIMSVNMCDCSKHFEYCTMNYISRFYGHGLFKNVMNLDGFPDLIQKLKDSISKDYSILFTLTMTLKENFESSLDDLILDEYFLLSVNQIVSEFPNILDSDVFSTRLRIVVNENIKNIKNIEDKKQRKMIYKNSKYYAKYLKGE